MWKMKDFMPINKDTFDIFAKHVDTRFDDMADLIRENRNHTHHDKVGWMALVPLLGALIGLVIGLG